MPKNCQQDKQGGFMYLTEEEFLVLTSFKMGLTHSQAKEKLGITIHTNDTRVANICKKYGIENTCSIRPWIAENVDMKKVQVFKQEEIPFYQYEHQEHRQAKFQ